MNKLAILPVLLAWLAHVGAVENAGAYQQCGGQGWTGATSCNNGYNCVPQNQYYSQCIPTPVASSTQAPQNGVVGAYGQCGGQGWSGNTQCQPGYNCVKGNDYYSQCVPVPSQPSTLPPNAVSGFPTASPNVKTFKPTAAISGVQVVYGQCGGEGWTGTTNCEAGSTCTVQHQYYSQCLPNPSAAPVSVAPTVLASGLAAGWAQCGGIDYTGATACAPGFTCVFYNDYYSQCVPIPSSTPSAAPPTGQPNNVPTSHPTSQPSGPTAKPTVNPDLNKLIHIKGDMILKHVATNTWNEHAEDILVMALFNISAHPRNCDVLGDGVKLPSSSFKVLSFVKSAAVDNNFEVIFENIYPMTDYAAYNVTYIAALKNRIIKKAFADNSFNHALHYYAETQHAEELSNAECNEVTLTTTITTEGDDSSSDDKKPLLSTGAIAGIAIGGFFAVSFLGFGIYYLFTRHASADAGKYQKPGDHVTISV
jgi:hypothetical protein